MTDTHDMTPSNHAPRLLLLVPADPPNVGAELHAIMERLREAVLMAGFYTKGTAADLERLAQIAAALTTLTHDEGDPQALAWLGLSRLED